MPKNKGKGGKNRKRGVNKNEPEKRELVLKEEGQEYGQVVKMLGNGRLDVYCFDNVKRLGVICGKMRKKSWVSNGDIVLVGLRDYQDGKCDVIMKYLQDEARELQKMKEIPDHCKLNETDETNRGGDDLGIVFDADISDSEEEKDQRATDKPMPDSDSESESGGDLDIDNM
eukprot:Sspe_Gene.4670::Locus_1544_Transcript_1_1_Confidence_1.000_Length_643::g.4670::m.4670/K03236/EIF1A; translation initiation factor 1A